MNQDALVTAVIAMSSAIAGAAIASGLTYKLTTRSERKNRLIEGAYRPLLGQIGHLWRAIEDYQAPNLAGLEKTRQDGMYWRMNEEIREIENEAYRKLADYKEVYGRALVRAWDIIKEEIRKALEYVADPERYRAGTWEVNFNASVNGVNLGSEDLRGCLLKGKSPVQILKERSPNLEESDIHPLVCGLDFERALADAIVKSALEKAGLDTFILDMRSKRESLLEDVQRFMDALRSYV